MEYCRTDVDTTYELIQNLPSDKLSPDQQALWVLTQRMNMYGLPVDVRVADKILSYITSYVDAMTHRVTEISSGQVQKVTQVKKLREWLAKYGIETDNLRAETVTEILKQDIHIDAKEMLELRQILGRSSTAKYKKIKEMQLHGRVYNNLQYHGTATGRWSGRGFQLQNLPRASVPDPEAYIDMFDNFEPVADPVNIAKALIRPMIKAPEGKVLLVSDYSSIENRLLAWVAQDEEALELFRTGGDQYIDMASFLYHKNTEEVTKSERQIGKIIILGCGYGMGAKRFVDTAKDWGVHLEQHEAQRAVDAYRDRYSKVKNLWYRLKDRCVDAIQNPGTTHTFKRVSFRVVKCHAGNRWLVLTLPSGRNLYYMDPYVSSDTYGLVPGHYGTDPYTKKWVRRKLIPGRIVENVIQALAADVMGYGLRMVEEHMPMVSLLGTVHDEAIAEAYEYQADLNKFNKCLCMTEPWAEGLPLAADGYIAKRYRK